MSSKPGGSGPPTSRGGSRSRIKKRAPGEGKGSSSAQRSNFDDDASSGSSEGVEPWSFKPSVKVQENGDNSILINTVVVKDSALTSALFAILEDERLDIVYENQYRTETKVAHTVLVNNLPPGYDVEALKQRLFQWAGMV